MPPTSSSCHPAPRTVHVVDKLTPWSSPAHTTYFLGETSAEGEMLCCHVLIRALLGEQELKEKTSFNMSLRPCSLARTLPGATRVICKPLCLLPSCLQMNPSHLAPFLRFFSPFLLPTSQQSVFQCRAVIWCQHSGNSSVWGT